MIKSLIIAPGKPTWTTTGNDTRWFRAPSAEEEKEEEKILELLEKVIKTAGDLGRLERFEWAGEGDMRSRKKKKGKCHDVWETLKKA
jgi:hypothetical protein